VSVLVKSNLMQEKTVLARTYLPLLGFGTTCAAKECDADWGTLEINLCGIIQTTCCSTTTQHLYVMCQLCGKLISGPFNLIRHQNTGNSCTFGAGKGYAGQQYAKPNLSRKTDYCIPPVKPHGDKPELVIEYTSTDLTIMAAATSFVLGAIAILKNHNIVRAKCGTHIVYWKDWPLDDSDIVMLLYTMRRQLQKVLTRTMELEEDTIVSSNACLLSPDLFINLNSVSKSKENDVRIFREAVGQ
jgi:hypothetical protein